MNEALLKKHVHAWVQRGKADNVARERDKTQRAERKTYYQSWTSDRILKMTEADLLEYLSGLWAMLIWGNKQYYVDKIIQDNGLEQVRRALSELVWGEDPTGKRWDNFRANVKGIGPAMMSELLCHVHPRDCMLWNRRAFVGLRYLGVEDLPRYNYQITGSKYENLTKTAKKIASELASQGINDPDLLTVDYFIWNELQVEDNLSGIHKPVPVAESMPEQDIDESTSTEFIHDEIKSKLADIGDWYGFKSRTEVKVADGSVVDTIWEATIGNMGRVIYVFEVQTRGSIDSLILNLLKSLNNPAVQGVVAVSDKKQLERIRKHAANVKDLNEKLKYWDYTKVLQVHEALEIVNEQINGLELVPQGMA